MPARLGLALLLAAVALGGCASSPDVDDGPERRIVAGELASTRPHHDALRVVVVSDGGLHTTAEFTRHEWYLAGLERAIEAREATRARIEGEDQALFEQVLARDVLEPDVLAGYRYDRMEMRAQSSGTPFDRAALDAEWTARLEELAHEAADDAAARVPVLDAAPTEG